MLVEQGRLSICAKFAQAFQKLDRGLQDTVTYVFSRVLSPVNQRLLICEMEQVIEDVSKAIKGLIYERLLTFDVFDCFRDTVQWASQSLWDTFSPL